MTDTRRITLDEMNFGLRRSITMDTLLRLQEPAVLCEGELYDSDGVKSYVYTVAGWLDGRNIATHAGGCTVEGEVIIIHGKDRKEADALAAEGLGDTISMLAAEAFGKVIGQRGGSLTEMLQKRGLLDPGENAGIITSAEARGRRH